MGESAWRSSSTMRITCNDDREENNNEDSGEKGRRKNSVREREGENGDER
jgi:hypothetical protein